MTGRFVSNITALLAGGVLVAASLGFAPGVTGWIGLAVGVVVTLATLVASALRGRGAVQRAIDVALLLAGGWTIVAARSFGGGALRWIMFADGTLVAALAVIGLVAHEVLVELALGRSPVAANGRIPRLPEGAGRTIGQRGG